MRMLRKILVVVVLFCGQPMVAMDTVSTSDSVVVSSSGQATPESSLEELGKAAIVAESKLTNIDQVPAFCMTYAEWLMSQAREPLSVARWNGYALCGLMADNAYDILYGKNWPGAYQWNHAFDRGSAHCYFEAFRAAYVPVIQKIKVGWEPAPGRVCVPDWVRFTKKSELVSEARLIRLLVTVFRLDSSVTCFSLMLRPGGEREERCQDMLCMWVRIGAVEAVRNIFGFNI